MKDEKGYPAKYWNTAATAGDAESWRRAEALMPQHRARAMEKYDSLTRLPNAGLTRELLEIAIDRTQGNDRFASVLLIDVEPSDSNTTAGGKYEIDVMLCKLACRLLACTSEEISLGQLSRLKFALVVGALRLGLCNYRVRCGADRHFLRLRRCRLPGKKRRRELMLRNHA